MCDWRMKALCAVLPAMPWISEPEDRSVAVERAMVAVCTACPVQLECAAYVERNGICAGFWAGRDQSPSRVRDGAA